MTFITVVISMQNIALTQSWDFSTVFGISGSNWLNDVCWCPRGMDFMCVCWPWNHTIQASPLTTVNTYLGSLPGFSALGWSQDEHGGGVLPVVVQQKRIWLGTMRLQVWSLALHSGLRIQCCRELWSWLQTWLGSGIAVVWCRLAATALMLPLAWEPPCAAGAALKKTKDEKKNLRIIMHTNDWSVKPQRTKE